MADRYSGPAFLQNLDGNETEVHAELHRRPGSGGLDDWSGTLAGDADWWRFMQQGQHAQLRMPDDRCGSLLLATHDVATNLVHVQGSAPCPFD